MVRITTNMMFDDSHHHATSIQSNRQCCEQIRVVIKQHWQHGVVVCDRVFPPLCVYVHRRKIGFSSDEDHTMQAQTSNLVRWSLKVSTEADIDLRTYLAQHGMRKGDLSKFVEEAVRRDILLRTMHDVAAHNAAISADAIEADINSALRESRAERLATALARPA